MIGFEQAILFAFHTGRRAASIVETAGEGFLVRGAVAQLAFSPVRDVAEDHQAVERPELGPADADRFRYLLEFRPETTACIGVPVRSRTELEYAIFTFDKHPRPISSETMRYMQAIALAIGTALEQKEFSERSAAVQQAARLGHVASAMVHEFNNAVTPLSARLERLRSRIHDIRRHGERAGKAELDDQWLLSELVEIQASVTRVINTTDMYRRISSKSKSEIVRVDELIDETIHFLRIMSQAEDVKVRFQRPESLLVIRSQAAALEQVLLNVLLNAVQQTALLKQGTTDGWVWIRTGQPFERVGSRFFRIYIEDNGPGIHASLWERIFDLGFSTRPGGSGIGLYMSRRILMEMGGNLRVHQSFRLGGTAFALEVPHQL